MTRLLTLILLLAATATASAQTTFVESFDGGGNEGGWWFGLPNPPIELTGGNPGAYLHEPAIDTFAPRPRTTATTSEFTGDYVAREVTGVGIDLITHAVDFSAGGRPCTLMLISGNLAVYQLGPNIPLEGQGWISYDFDVPSASPTLPAGWLTIDLTSGAPAPTAWPTVISNVEQVQFFYGDPTYFFIFQFWDIGLDNPRITTAGAPVATFVRGDCNDDGNSDIADPVSLLAFLFPQGTPPGLVCDDACDTNDDGQLNIADAIAALTALFGVPAVPLPPPNITDGCGPDPTDLDPLGCDAVTNCP